MGGTSQGQDHNNYRSGSCNKLTGYKYDSPTNKDYEFGSCTAEGYKQQKWGGGQPIKPMGGHIYRQSKRNKNNSIIFATLNAQSLKRKKDELILKAQMHKPLIIGVTETWGNEKIDDANFKLDGYVMYRSDRLGRRGGGTILYIATILGQSTQQ